MCFSQLYCYKAPEPGSQNIPEERGSAALASLLDSCWQVAVCAVHCLCSDGERKKGLFRGTTARAERGDTDGLVPPVLVLSLQKSQVDAEFQSQKLSSHGSCTAGKEWPHFIPVLGWQGDVQWQLCCAWASGKLSVEFGFSFSILPTHLHVPRYYRTLKVLLVGNINFVWRVVLALGWLPAWKCLSAIAFPWSHYALASGFTKPWVVCAVTLSLYMSFAMKLEFLIWKKLHLEQLLSGKRILGRNHDQLCPWCQCNTCLTGF